MRFCRSYFPTLYGVTYDTAIPHSYNALRVLRDTGIVSDEHDGVAGIVQRAKQGHNLCGGGAVQVAGRLVRKEDTWIGNYRTRNGQALTLAARKLPGLVL
jgi:hypothetical protein